MENNVNNIPQNNTVYRPQASKIRKKGISINVNIDKLFLWNALNVFISGLLGGVAFAIGGTVFLSVNNKSVGSALFTIGMIIIYAYGFGFYTSKIG